MKRYRTPVLWNNKPTTYEISDPIKCYYVSSVDTMELNAERSNLFGFNEVNELISTGNSRDLLPLSVLRIRIIYDPGC